MVSDKVRATHENVNILEASFLLPSKEKEKLRIDNNNDRRRM